MPSVTKLMTAMHNVKVHIMFNTEIRPIWSKVQKWVSDANPVNIGELDHYVVFGTKSGVIQGFQRGQKCFIEVKQNLVDPPTPTKTPSKTPKTQYLTLPIANLIPL